MGKFIAALNRDGSARFGRALISRTELGRITSQLSVLLNSGVGLIDSLDCVAGVASPAAATALNSVARRTSQGVYFSRALGEHPREFPKAYLAMVKVGENSGMLAANLEVLADWLDRDDRFVRRLYAALAYPAFVLAVALALAVLTATTVLPSIHALLTDLSVPLPLVTRVVMLVSAIATRPASWLTLIAVLIVAAATAREQLKEPENVRQVHRLALHLPMVGPVLTKVSLARFCTALANLSRSGVDLLRALKLAGEVSGSPLLAEDCVRASLRIERGLSLSESLLESEHLDSQGLAQMAALGEETGRLHRVFFHLAEIYRSEVEYRLDILTAAIEPLITFFVASLVAVVVVAVVLPLYATVQHL